MGIVQFPLMGTAVSPNGNEIGLRVSVGHRGCNLNCVSKANKKSINFANTVFL